MIKKLVGLAVTGAVVVPLAFASPGPTPGGERVSVSIEGHVRDGATGAAVGGAQVFIVGTLIGTLTDAKGFYALETEDDAMVGSTVTVTVRVIGFTETSQEVSIETAGTITVDFEIEQTALRLQDIRVTGLEEDSPQTRLPLTVKALEPGREPTRGRSGCT